MGKKKRAKAKKRARAKIKRQSRVVSAGEGVLLTFVSQVVIATFGEKGRKRHREVLFYEEDPEVVEAFWQKISPRANELPSPSRERWRRILDGEAGRQVMGRLFEKVPVWQSVDERLVEMKPLPRSLPKLRLVGSGDVLRLQAANEALPPGDPRQIVFDSVRHWNSTGYYPKGDVILDFGRTLPPAFLAVVESICKDKVLSAAEVQGLLEATTSAGIEALFDQETVARFANGDCDCEPTPVLVLSEHGLWPTSQRLAAAVAFRYPEQKTGRNAAYEKDAITGVRKSKIVRPDTLGSGYYVESKRFLSVVPELLAQGWEIESCGGGIHLDYTTQFDLQAVDDDYELQVTLQFGDQQVTLTAAQEACARGESVIQLPDGTLAALPEEHLLQLRFLEILSSAKANSNKIHVKANQLSVLRLWLQDGDNTVRFCGEGKWREDLARLDGIDLEGEVDAHPDFVGELRAYQRQGLGWLRYLKEIGYGGCLADDMGLGKTIQVLAYLLEVAATEGNTPSLVVVPRSLLDNWFREARKFTPSLKVAVVHRASEFPDAHPLEDADVVLTTYGTLRTQLDRFRQPYAVCVLDEAQVVKNPQAKVTQCVRQIRAGQKLCLTGTPVENHLGDLWSLFEFINPGLLGQSTRFARLVENPSLALGSTTLRALSNFLHPFILRRTKERVLTELPAKTETTIYCELKPQQRQAYDALRKVVRKELDSTIAAQGFGKSKFSVLEALLRLRQCACDPALIDPEMREVGSAKLDFVMRRLAELREEGHKVLVFSQFTSFLALLRERLDANGRPYAYLDGKTRKRQDEVDRFQNDPEVGIFLLSLKAGGTGLNLTAASYVFILDPWWNPAAERQAVDRAHRIGQAQAVFAYRVVAKDTVESGILALQEKKKALADAILTADKSILKRLTADDLRLLLGDD